MLLAEFLVFYTFGMKFVLLLKKTIKMKMKLTIIALFLNCILFAQNSSAFDVGEWFKFRIHYGFINAGYATLELKEATVNDTKVFYAQGHGYTTGMAKSFFKVEDFYQSFIDKKTSKPYQFLRKIDEGGYTKNQEGFFNQSTNKVLIKDYKSNTEKTFDVTENIQDIVSSFYYLRNHPKINTLKVGESILIDMFFDDEIVKFKLKFMGREQIRTKFGKSNTMIFRPLVQSGRVFKEEESLTVWISDDQNKIPLRIKAELAVGSLKADLETFKGLKAPFMTIQK
jgi:hypothetical protein